MGRVVRGLLLRQMGRLSHGLVLHQLRIFDTASTKLVKEFRPPGSNTRGGWTRSFVRFSPDGKFLIAQEHTGRVETFDIYRYVIWGVEDGRCYWSSEKTGGWMSGGNRYLIGFFGKNKTVLDLLTDQEVAIRNAPTTDRRLIGMSRDGKVLAFVGTKTGAERVPGFPKLSVFLTPAPTLPDLGGHPDGDFLPPISISPGAGQSLIISFARNSQSSYSQRVCANPSDMPEGLEACNADGNGSFA